MNVSILAGSAPIRERIAFRVDRISADKSFVGLGKLRYPVAIEPLAACCEPENTAPIISHELSGGGSMIDVSNMKSVLARYSSCLNPPALADKNRSYSDSQIHRRPRYFIASSSDLVGFGGFGEGFSTYRC